MANKRSVRLFHNIGFQNRRESAHLSTDWLHGPTSSKSEILQLVKEGMQFLFPCLRNKVSEQIHLLLLAVQ